MCCLSGPEQIDKVRGRDHRAQAGELVRSAQCGERAPEMADHTLAVFAVRHWWGRFGGGAGGGVLREAAAAAARGFTTGGGLEEEVA